MDGFAFVGEIVDGKVAAHIYFNDNLITICRVEFTLDEWLQARTATHYADEVAVLTESEYADATSTAAVES